MSFVERCIADTSAMNNAQLSGLERYVRTTYGYYNDVVGIESQRLPFFQQAYNALNGSLKEMAT